jgi:hypothetical protein
MSNLYVKEAVSAFEIGQYEQAIVAYKKAEARLGKGLFDFNIALCKRLFNKSVCIKEVNEEVLSEVLWHDYSLSLNESIILSGDLIGIGIKGRKALLLAEVFDQDGKPIDLSSYGFSMSTTYGKWFKYLYPNQSSGVLFEFNNSYQKCNVKLSLVKFGCTEDQHLFVNNKIVKIEKKKDILTSLESYLTSNLGFGEV